MTPDNREEVTPYPEPVPEKQDHEAAKDGTEVTGDGTEADMDSESELQRPGR